MTMSVESIVVDRDKARELWRAYQTHRHHQSPLDREIARTYQLMAQGRVVIKAIESVVNAGLGPDRLPKLALIRADAQYCHLIPYSSGGARMQIRQRVGEKETRSFVDFPPGSFPGIDGGKWRAQALVPLIPVNLRPKRALENYHVLFEAEWTRTVPVDPMLLRRIGRADMWVVLAAWDLTAVERAALAVRLNG